MFVGRQDVISEYVARNAETLELFDPDNPPDFRQMIRGAVESIHLTPEQEEVIARYAPVWGRVMVPVDREFADLQQQISSAEVRLSTPCSSGSSNDSSSSSANASQQHPADSGSKTTSTHQLHDGPARAAQLEAQLQLLQRLKIVMHKKRMLTVGCSAWFLGRLSVPQAVRLAVLTWPYPVVYAMAAMVIQERWESQQQPSTRAPQPQAAA
jgi:hypothetical protein